MKIISDCEHTPREALHDVAGKFRATRRRSEGERQYKRRPTLADLEQKKVQKLRQDGEERLVVQE